MKGVGSFFARIFNVPSRGGSKESRVIGACIGMSLLYRTPMPNTEVKACCCNKKPKSRTGANQKQPPALHGLGFGGKLADAYLKYILKVCRIRGFGQLRCWLLGSGVLLLESKASTTRLERHRDIA